MELRIELKKPFVGDDGVLHVGLAHAVALKIGNVSVAFDGRPDHPDGPFSLLYGEYDPDPVRIDDTSVTDADSPAEKLLLALADSLGYDCITKKG